MYPICIVAALAALLGTSGVQPKTVLPDVAEVQRRATLYARLDLGEAARWKRKARMAALVPKIQIDYGRRFRNDIDIDINDNVYVGSSGVVVGPEDGKYSSGYTADHNIGFRAVWEFSEAVFSPKQLAVSAEMRRIAHARQSLMNEVVQHYYAVAGCADELKLLRGMRTEAKSPQKVDHSIFVRRIACEESAAALDALTDGWFRGQVEGEPCR